MRHPVAILFVLAVVSAGCSEDLGPAPPDGGSRVGVAVEAAAGPRFGRSGISLEVVDGVVWVGTDSGLHRFDTIRRSWAPAHAGYLPDEERETPGRVSALSLGDAGRRILFTGEVGVLTTIGASDDAGRTFRSLPRPDPTRFGVDAIAVAPPSPRWPGGAWLAAQGIEIHALAAGDADWQPVVFDAPLQRIDRIVADTGGRVLVGGATPEGGAELWSIDDEGSRRVAAVEGTSVLDIDPAPAEAPVFATDAGVWRGTERQVVWDGRILRAARVRTGAGGIEWVVLTDDDRPGRSRLAQGRGPVSLDAAAGTLVDAAAPAVALGSGAAWTVDERAAVLRVDATGTERFEFGSTSGALSAVARIDDDPPRLAVARRADGEVLVGPPEDSDAFVSRGSWSTSTVMALTADPRDPTVLLQASFGCYQNAESAQAWVGRNTGFVPYEVFLGDRFGLITLEVVADGTLWSGGDNGEGPYRWDPVGGRWQRVHEGLGTPRSTPFGTSESGLPYVTQVRDFALDTDGTTWMAGFRGGAWRLDETGAGAPVWRGTNTGLPDLDGAPMDTCCVVAPDRQVDVRAIEAAEGGVLLAATGWGVFGRETDDGAWTERSLGLSNRDVRDLAVHPDEAATVVAVARGRADAPDWVFLSEDAGRTWFAVDASLVAAPGVDVVWSRPGRREITVRIEGRGAWRMELDR